MPIHDWTRVDAGTFHDFHQVWTVAIRSALNRGLLPEGFFAMTDQVISGPVPDVVTLQSPASFIKGRPIEGGIAVEDAPPATRFVSRAEEEDIYARKANRIAIRHQRGQVVAIIEVVSPGNKNSQHAIRTFVEKVCDLMNHGISLLILDLFPPSRRDPQGIHKAVWDEIHEEAFELPADKPLTLVAYSAGVSKTAYIEPVAVGDALPDMPVFLAENWYVNVPLERTYQAAWDDCPNEIRGLLEA
jgi:hypothetical protein